MVERGTTAAQEWIVQQRLEQFVPGAEKGGRVGCAIDRYSSTSIMMAGNELRGRNLKSENLRPRGDSVEQRKIVSACKCG
jgi:hypothetical protein